ncbi:hypothetical protein LTR08_007930 [Meristemomyces frigidus]|nr:hypothetical protein LTR08_007930 [Meristemomyces frigidus]
MTTFTPTAATTAPQPRRLFSLPQELQDITFRYAYPARTGVRYTHVSMWTIFEREQRKSNHDHVRRPFPAPMVNDWMVSKRFFVMAVRSYIQNQDFGDRADVLATTACCNRTGVLLQYATTVRVLLWNLQLLKTLPNLKCVTLELDEDAFEAIEPKWAWQCILGDDDFRALEAYNALITCCNLKQVIIVAGSCTWADTMPKMDMWKRNAEAFQALVNRDIKERECDTTPMSSLLEKGPVPLYGGSKVCFEPFVRADLNEDVPNSSNQPMVATTRLETACSTAKLLCDKENDRDSSGPENGTTHTLLRSPCGPSAAYAPQVLPDCDIPEHLSDWYVLLSVNGEAMMEWVRYAKDMTCGMPLKGEVYSTGRMKSHAMVTSGMVEAGTQTTHDMGPNLSDEACESFETKTVETQTDDAKMVLRDSGAEETGQIKPGMCGSHGAATKTDDQVRMALRTTDPVAPPVIDRCVLTAVLGQIDGGLNKEDTSATATKKRLMRALQQI